jgi:hypothetical protein
VGGYNKFGEGAMATKKMKLPDHKRIRIKVQLWKIDSWDGEELYIRVGEVKVFSIKLGFNDPGILLFFNRLG